MKNTYSIIYNQKNMPCKVCFDAGKSAEEVASHYVKNQFGMVICPTLLSQNCLRCGYIGHTPAYCVNIPIQHMSKEGTKKFCPVCHQRGASIDEYTDHNLSEDGVVVCEFLLDCECRNCGDKGHTPKYCPHPKKVSPMKRLEENHNLSARLEKSLLAPVPEEPRQGKKRKYVRVL